MSNYVLDKAYRVEPEDGISAARVVVRGTQTDACTLPAGANRGGILGITTHAQPRTGRYIGVRRIGIAQAEAAGVIETGDLVAIADDGGRVARLQPPRFELGVPASGNAINIEWMDRSSFSAATIVEIAEPAVDGPFAWSLIAGILRLYPTRASGDIVMTAAELKTAIDEDDVLSHLLRATIPSGSSGTGVVDEQSVSAENLPATMNPVGIAEESAAQAGDLVDVFLIA